MKKVLERKKNSSKKKMTLAQLLKERKRRLLKGQSDLTEATPEKKTANKLKKQKTT